MKVYVADSHSLDGDYDYSIERGIIEDAGHEFILRQCADEDDVAKECRDADALLVINIKIGKKSICAMNNCRVMVRFGIGYDNIDIEAATASGIRVCNIPHYCIPEVATHSSALILAATRNLLNYALNMRAGLYNKDAEEFLTMHRPSAQVVGLLGFGNIARAVAGHMRAIGYSVIAYDPYLDEATFEGAGARRVDLDELFSEADVISCHVPYSKATHHIINADSIAKMKAGVVIVNTARGPLVDEDALVMGLMSEKVGAAGLDVFESEPFKPADHPFYHMDNVILTPHAAYNSVEASHEFHKQIAETTVAVLKGEILSNIVNKKQLEL